MRRIIGRIVHNWPLKLAAVGLATLMYGGLAVSQNTQTFLGVVPVRVVNQPPGTVLLSVPDPVTQIRYFAAPDVPVATSTFRAVVDLSGVEPTGEVTSVRIEVDSPDGRVRVLNFEPAFATIQLDRLDSKKVPVKVEHGTVPDGLELGDTTIDPPEVTVSGAASVIRQVVWARADVLIQPDGPDVDQEVELTPIDGNGNAVRPVDVTPSTVRVVIPVFTDRQTQTLPVNPVVTGTPAAGFEIASISVEPPVVLVQGDAERLAELVRVDTIPIPIGGVSTSQTVTTGLDLPTGIIPVGDDTVVVTIDLRPVTSTRTFSAGLRLVGARSDLTYEISVDSVLMTIGGSSADLDRLSGSTLTGDLDVTDLTAGTTDVVVSAELPTGTTLVTVSPPRVTVTVTGPTPSIASPVPSSGPSASGG